MLKIKTRVKIFEIDSDGKRIISMK